MINKKHKDSLKLMKCFLMCFISLVFQTNALAFNKYSIDFLNEDAAYHGTNRSSKVGTNLDFFND